MEKILGKFSGNLLHYEFCGRSESVCIDEKKKDFLGKIILRNFFGGFYSVVRKFHNLSFRNKID